MSEWIHCNACYFVPDNASRFYLTRCGHLLCFQCNTKAIRSGACSVCNCQNVMTVDILSDELPDNIKLFFVPGDKVQAQFMLCLEEMRKQCDVFRDLTNRILECAKIVEFQKNNGSRLVGYCRKHMKKIEQLEVKEKTANEKIGELENKLRKQQSELDELKRAQQNANPFASSMKARDDSSGSQAYLFDQLLPTRSRVPSTPQYQPPAITSSNEPQSVMSSARSALREIASAVQAKTTAHKTFASSLLPQELRHAQNSSPQTTSQTFTRAAEPRLSLKATNPNAVSPAQPPTGRIAVAAFQGKTRIEHPPATPITIFSDSCSVGSLDSPRSVASGAGAVHRRPGSIVAPSPIIHLPRTPDSLRISEHLSTRMPMSHVTGQSASLALPSSSHLTAFKSQSHRFK